ncbi:MAG: tungsten cofactor oxidoreductase radical SAM maturase [Candidatus Odinarchaeota archaeon]
MVENLSESEINSLIRKIKEKTAQSPLGKIVVIDEVDHLLIIPPKPDIKKVYVELTNKCNLNCQMCIRRSWLESLEEMGYEDYLKLLDQLTELPELKTIVFGGLGEPTIHPKFKKIVESTRSRLPEIELVMTTNGTMIDRFQDLIIDNFDYMIVSIDAVSEDVFKGIRGPQAGKVINNLKNFAEYRNKIRKFTPWIWVEFVAMRQNIEELPKLLAIAKDLQISRIMISNMLPYTPDMTAESLYPHADPEEIYKWIPVGPDLKNYIQINVADTRIRTERSCAFIKNKAAVITVNGDVTSCYNFAHTYRSYINGHEKTVYKYSFGNIHSEKLKDIWMKEEYVRFRNKVSDFNFPSCIDCPTREGCSYANTNEVDCYGNTPSCAECLWSRDIVRCP